MLEALEDISRGSGSLAYRGVIWIWSFGVGGLLLLLSRFGSPHKRG